MLLKIHPKHAMKGPGGGAGKALTKLVPDACKGLGGERHALPPGKRPGIHGKGDCVCPHGQR